MAARTAQPTHYSERFYVPERMVISPCAGVFAPVTDPTQGNPIKVGTVIGRVGGQEVRSAFAGCLMGMLALPGERVYTSQPVAWLRSA